MKLLCLLPVRNGEEDLPFYLQSVSTFADGMIALDDGSTDATYEILNRHPLVLETLRNPVRPTYVGWNDLENRLRLLRAAERYRPDWILWLDADEVLEPSDAAILRDFIEREGKQRVAYSFEVLRMIGDMSTYDKCGWWKYRLYSFESGYTFREQPLHFPLVPEQFDPDARVRTNLRILHRASLTDERRRIRYDKYAVCDPELKWQDSYENLLDPARNVSPLRPRQPGDPVIIPLETSKR